MMSTATEAGVGAVVEHAADEAGGEVVFSSDGFNPPPPIQLRPPPIRQTATASADGGGGDGGGVDYTDVVSVEQAFEAFAGKLYPVEKRVVATSSSSFMSKKASLETPLERLQRLHAEVKELESDLQQGNSQQQGDNDGTNTYTCLAMLASIQQIKTRLETAQTNNALPFAEYQLQQQQALARQIASSTSALQEPLPAAAAASLPAAAADAAIFARLQKLEAVLGASATTNSNNSASSLMQRLSVLEKSMSRLDEKELEALTKKAKVIRQDLEAASKARSKLMSVGTTTATSSSSGGASSSGGGGHTSAMTGGSMSTSTNIRAEDSKTITDLHDELIQLQGMTTHLPVLCQRLQSLAQLHASTATYGARLQAIEDVACLQLPIQVQVVEGALTKMEQNLQTSVQQMMQNVQALQERVDKL